MAANIEGGGKSSLEEDIDSNKVVKDIKNYIENLSEINAGELVTKINQAKLNVESKLSLIETVCNTFVKEGSGGIGEEDFTKIVKEIGINDDMDKAKIIGFLIKGEPPEYTMNKTAPAISFLADHFEIKNEKAKALIIRHCIDNIGDLIRFEMVHEMLKDMGIKDGKNVDEMMRATKIDENTKKAMSYYLSHYFGILKNPKFEESKSSLNRGGQAPMETNKLSSNAQGVKQNSTSSDTSFNTHAGPQTSPKEDTSSNPHTGPQTSPKEDTSSNPHAGPGTSPRPTSFSKAASSGRTSSNGSNGSEFLV